VRPKHIHDAVVHRLVDRVVPHQRRAFGATPASRRSQRRRPRQAQTADIRFIDLLEQAVTLFRLRQAVGKPGARQSVLGGARGSKNFRVNRARLLGDERRSESESGDDAGGPQDSLVDLESGHDIFSSKQDDDLDSRIRSSPCSHADSI
jgi:hypothetical protein